MTGQLYWLASYPKSGNTWMRILLTNYLRDADEPADINSLDGGPIASARQVFDEFVGIEASDLTQDEIERLRPRVYDRISEHVAEQRAEDSSLPPPFLKVHDAFTYTADGVPLISKAATAGAIYLVRNPLDVAVSFAHHSGSPVERTVVAMGAPSFTMVDRPQRLHNQLRQHLLSWSGHVTSWVDEPGLRTLVVRYEDLLTDTAATFARTLGFAGMEVDEDRVEKAVDFSRFDRLQQQETEAGFRERTAFAPSFFRSGRADGWRDELSDELVERIVADHGDVMRRFGYLE